VHHRLRKQGIGPNERLHRILAGNGCRVTIADGNGGKDVALAGHAGFGGT
jgi:hypothetical protein